MSSVVGDFVVECFVEDAFGHDAFPELDSGGHDGVDELVHQRLRNTRAQRELGFEVYGGKEGFEILGDCYVRFGITGFGIPAIAEENQL